MRLKHTIILIIGDLERERYADIMEKIPKGNDTIFLLLLHPLECDTQRDGQSILFESQVISESYRRALQEEMTYREYDCSSRQIAFLSTTTEENPSLFLNHFFKYRYA